MITVSNELTPAADINPTRLNKALPKTIQLFHLSWASILTAAFLLASSSEDPYNNDDEAYLVSELIRYLDHSGSGLVPLDQMNRDWPKTVSDVQSSHPINSKSDEIVEMIAVWHQEARDIALIMTRLLKEPVSIAASRANLANPSVWIEQEAKQFAADKILSFELDVPNTASKMLIEADFLRRAVRVSMKVAAPTDRNSNSARVNWLLKQLSKSERKKIIIRCITRGKGQNFGAMADEIDPKSDEIRDLGEIVSFQLEMSADLGARFNSRKKFVECLEEIVPDFYNNVGQYVQAFVPPPPKYSKEGVSDIPEEQSPAAPAAPMSADKATEKMTERPVWVAAWQTSPITEPDIQS